MLLSLFCFCCSPAARSRESSLDVKLPFAFGESLLAVVTVKELVGETLLLIFSTVEDKDVAGFSSTFCWNCFFSRSAEILLGSPI